jgi:hypothetical protein
MSCPYECLRRFHSLGKWLFWASVIASGIVGGRSFEMLPTNFIYHLDNSSLFFVSHQFSLIFLFDTIVAIFCFLLLYWGLAVQVIGIIEWKNAIEIHKPSIKRGIIYTALFIPIWYLLSLLYIFWLFATGRMHDSM